MVNRDSRPRVVLAGRRRQARAGTLADRTSPGPSDRLPTSSVGSRSRRSHHRGARRSDALPEYGSSSAGPFGRARTRYSSILRKAASLRKFLLKPLGQRSLHGRRPNLASEFEGSMRPDEIVQIINTKLIRPRFGKFTILGTLSTGRRFRSVLSGAGRTDVWLAVIVIASWVGGVSTLRRGCWTAQCARPCN